MEEIFPLTDQVNLLSETSRYAYDSLLTSQFLNYGTKSNANKSITNINTTCNNNTCSPLPSKRQNHRESLRRQTGRMSRSGIWSHFRLDTKSQHTKSNTIDSKCKKLFTKTTLDNWKNLQKKVSTQNETFYPNHRYTQNNHRQCTLTGLHTSWSNKIFHDFIRQNLFKENLIKGSLNNGNLVKHDLIKENLFKFSLIFYSNLIKTTPLKTCQPTSLYEPFKEKLTKSNKTNFG